LRRCARAAQVLPHVEAMQTSRSDDREERSGALGVVVATTEQPRLAPGRDGFQRAFSPVVAQHEFAIFEEACERLSLVVRVFERGACVPALVSVRHALLVDPGEETFDVNHELVTALECAMLADTRVTIRRPSSRISLGLRI
jgi:hypothetical protein